MIKLKRVYEAPAAADGFRILVERLWPRGLSKNLARIDLWLKDVAPSPELRKWFSHETGKWEQFRERYYEELRLKQDLINLLKQKEKGRTVTFVFASRDERHNSALALKEFIERVV
jgi:uncharacterized protein YeaO (DUF488 family)